MSCFAELHSYKLVFMISLMPLKCSQTINNTSTGGVFSIKIFLSVVGNDCVVIQIKIESHRFHQGFVFLLMGMRRNIHTFYLKSTTGITQYEFTCFHKGC